MKKVYRFFWDCGRMGCVEGLFAADEKDVATAIGNEVYFGEILGKHSEVYGTLEDKDLNVLSDSPEVVEFVEKHASIGYNPLDYLQIRCEECGETLEDCGESFREDVLEACDFEDCPHRRTSDA